MKTLNVTNLRLTALVDDLRWVISMVLAQGPKGPPKHQVSPSW